MKIMEIDVKKFTSAQKKAILGKSGSAESMGTYLDLTKETLGDGILLVDSNDNRTIGYIGELKNYDTQAVFDYLNTIKIQPNNRMSRGVASKHVQIGFMPGNGMKGNVCTPTERTETDETLRVFGYYMSVYGEEQYKLHMPKMYEDHVAQMDKLLDKDLLLNKESLFTSAVINRSNEIQFHYDKGNTAEGATLMCYVCQDVSGGELLIPEMDLAINIRDNVFILMEGHKFIHGVAKMERTTPTAERYSIVFYSKRGLFLCDSNVQEEKDDANKKNTAAFLNKVYQIDDLRKMNRRSLELIKERYGDILDQDILDLED